MSKVFFLGGERNQCVDVPAGIVDVLAHVEGVDRPWCEPTRVADTENRYLHNTN
jgi:hypothetical protein